MKLANLDGRAVLVRDDEAIDVAEASGGKFGPSLQSVYDNWDAVRAAADGWSGPTITIDSERLGPPSPTPRQVFAIGLNYRAHAVESGMELPDMPATFTKFPSALTGPIATVELAGETVDWEIELVAVVGAQARNVSRDNAWRHIAGLTVGQDLSERTVQMAAGRQFSLGKSFPGFAPTGPWLVTPDEFADPDDIGLGCSIDGETVQSSRTNDLVFDIPTLVETLSSIVTLYPGDLIFTGTPSGVGMARTPPRFLTPDNVLESWIDGIGTMKTRFRAKESSGSS